MVEAIQDVIDALRVEQNRAYTLKRSELIAKLEAALEALRK
jgi:hypothetical protein